VNLARTAEAAARSQIDSAGQASWTQQISYSKPNENKSIPKDSVKAEQPKRCKWEEGKLDKDMFTNRRAMKWQARRRELH